jgi:hypothetical protein
MEKKSRMLSSGQLWLAEEVIAYLAAFDHAAVSKAAK